MAQISFNHASYNRPNPHLRVGKKQLSKAVPCFLVKDSQGVEIQMALTVKSCQKWASKLPDMSPTALLIRLINGNAINIDGYLLKLQH